MERNSLKNEVIRAQDILKQIQMRFATEYQLNANILEEIKVYKQKLQFMEDERNQSLIEIEKHLSIIAKTNEELQQRLNSKDSWLRDADEEINPDAFVKEEEETKDKSPESVATKNLTNISTSFKDQRNEGGDVKQINGAPDPPNQSTLEKYLEDLYHELCSRVQAQQSQAKSITSEPTVELAAIKSLLDEGEERLQRLSTLNKGNWTKDNTIINPSVAEDQVSSSIYPPKSNNKDDPINNVKLPLQDGWVNETNGTSLENQNEPSFSQLKIEALTSGQQAFTPNSSGPDEGTNSKSPTARPVGPVKGSFQGDQTDLSSSYNEKLLGKGKDYFEEMFYEGKEMYEYGRQSRTGRTHVTKPRNPLEYKEYNAITSSAIGHLCILEINDEGKFVRIYNADGKDAEIGNYLIKQNVGGHPVIVFRFPPRTKFPRNSIITIWAASRDNDVFHDPPSNYIWDAQVKWGTGPEFTTILCKPNGQAIAWTNAAHRFNPQLSPQIPITPVHIRTTQRAASSSPIETKPACRNEMALMVRTPVNAWDRDLIFLKRPKTSPDFVPCVKHPYGLPPGNIGHPCSGKEETKSISSTSSPITHSNSNKVSQKQFSSKRCTNVKGQKAENQNNRANNWKPSTNRTNTTKMSLNKKSTFDLLPCTAFMKPSMRLQFGLEMLRSSYNMSYNPPMPKPSKSAW